MVFPACFCSASSFFFHVCLLIILFSGSLLTNDCILVNENTPSSLPTCFSDTGDEKTKFHLIRTVCSKIRVDRPQKSR